MLKDAMHPVDAILDESFIKNTRLCVWLVNFLMGQLTQADLESDEKLQDMVIALLTETDMFRLASNLNDIVEVRDNIGKLMTNIDCYLLEEDGGTANETFYTYTLNMIREYSYIDEMWREFRNEYLTHLNNA